MLAACYEKLQIGLIELFFAQNELLLNIQTQAK